MPLDNEPLDIVPSGDFSLESRDNQGQASVTFKAQSRGERPLGEGGETRGIAKREMDDVRRGLLDQVDEVTVAAKQRLEEIRNEIQLALLTTEDLEIGQRQKMESQVIYLNKKIEAGWPDFDMSSVLTQIPEFAGDRAIKRYTDLDSALKGQLTTSETIQPLISRPLSHPETQVLDLGEQDVHLLTRAVASSSVDRLLGTDCLAQEKFGQDEHGQPIGISVQVDGLGVMGTLPNTHTYFMDVDYSSHNVQKGLYDLEALDYITGQIDRHAGNIFIDPETGKVHGIDNDLAFPQMDRSEMVNKQGGPSFPVKNLPRYMHEDTARKIESLRPEELRETLSNIGYPPDGSRGKLTKEEIDGSVKRLEEMQQHIGTLRNEGRVVRQFNKETYDEAVEHQEKTSLDELRKLDSYEGVLVTVDTVTGPHLTSTSKTSYVGTVALEKHVSDKNIVLGTGESHSFDSLKVELDSTGKALRDPEFAEFSRLTENLRHEERQLLTSMHTPQFAQLNSRLREVEENIETMKNPGKLDKIGAIPKGGVTAARQQFEQERLGILQEIRDLEKSIDDRVEQTVENAKEQLYLTAEFNVAFDIQLGPKPPQPNDPHYGSFEDFRGKKVVGAGGATGSGRVKVDGENFQLKSSIEHGSLKRWMKAGGLNHENYGEVIASNISKAVVGEDNRGLIPDVLIRQDEQSHEPKVTSRYLQGGSGDLDDLYRREMGKIDPEYLNSPKDENDKLLIVDERGRTVKHAHITLEPTGVTSKGVLALKGEAAQDVRRNIALSALMGDHDVNPGNMISVNNDTRVGRIDFGHAFNELITGPGGRMTGGGGVRYENNRILDFFNREKVSGAKLGGDPSKLWRDYDGIGPSMEMSLALREVAANKEALDGLVHAKAQFVDLVAQLEAEGTPEARKELEDVTKSLAKISSNLGMPVTSTKPGDVARDVFQNLNTFVENGQKQMVDVADLCEMQARIDTFLRNPANEGKKLPDDFPQDIKDLYEKLSRDDSSVKATNGQGLQFMKNSKSEKAVSGDLESYAKARQQVVRLERGEGPALNEIDKLEARKAQLQNNPSAGDHVKAFFKHGTGGIQGEIESIDKKLDTLRAAVHQAQHGVSVQDDRDLVARLKDMDRSLKQQYDEYRQEVGLKIANGMSGLGPKPSEQELAGMQQRLDELTNERENIQARIKKEEGVISVREKLGIKTNPQTPLRVDAPQQGVEDGGVELRVGPEVHLDEELPQVKLERSQSVRDFMKPKVPKPGDEGPEVGVRPRSMSTK